MLRSMKRVNRFVGRVLLEVDRGADPEGKASTTTATPIQNVPRRPWKMPASSGAERCPLDEEVAEPRS